MGLSLSHITTRQVAAGAEAAFRFLCDPLAAGRWSLGCFDTEAAGEAGLHTGRSLIDGAQAWFRIDADPERLAVDFLVGTPDHLVRRISARVVPGEQLGYPVGSCLVSMIAWRTAGMSDEGWVRLQALHEAEIFLIAGQIEQAVRDPR
jgi:hypothetical protein